MSFITEIKVSNCKKISHISWKPGVGIVEIGGPCAEGKSSLEDAILYAFGGEKVIPSMPLRQGATKGEIEITEDTGTVTTRKLGKGAGLEVRNEKGFPMPKPQQICNEKIGSLIFDPLAFSRMKAAEQREKVVELTGLDFSEMDYERDQVFDERTMVNREIKTLKAKASVLPKTEGPPVASVSINELVSELRAREEWNATCLQSKAKLEQARADYKNIQDEIEDLEVQLADRQKALAGAAQEGKLLSKLVEDFEPQDVEEIREQIANIESTNAQAHAFEQRAELEKELGEAESKAEQMTVRIGELDEQKKAMLAQAPFPVPGLSFNETEVLYNGIPLSQASGAEQVIISAAIGMALSPDPDKLQIMIVREGGLLDDAKRLELYKLVRDRGFQLFIEQPGVDGDVVIVDGAIADEEMIAEAKAREAEARELLEAL
jgi:hypothetical protein